MANGDALFEEVRNLLDRNEVPDDLTRRALWGALAVVYKQLDSFGEDYKTFKRDSIEDRKGLNKVARILGGFTGLLLVISLPDLAKGADALWKLILALL
jgi:hypothetical protein